VDVELKKPPKLTIESYRENGLDNSILISIIDDKSNNTYVWGNNIYGNSVLLPYLSGKGYNFTVFDSDGCEYYETYYPQILYNKPVVYPNPFKESLYINFVNLKQENYSVEIFDLKGNILYSLMNIKNEGVINLSKEASMLNKGIYYLLLSFDKKGIKYLIKIIKT